MSYKYKRIILYYDLLKETNIPSIITSREGVFVISAIEVVDWKIIIVCIYRSLSSSRESFLSYLRKP
jgi:hypothetical protein